MRKRIEKSTLNLGALELKNWDVVAGRSLLALWQQMEAQLGINSHTTVCFNVGKLTDWAVKQYETKNSLQSRISPTEHLNVEGARLARFLTGHGWNGQAFVVSCVEANFEQICRHIPGDNKVVGVRLSQTNNSVEDPEWAMHTTVFEYFVPSYA